MAGEQAIDDLLVSRFGRAVQQMQLLLQEKEASRPDRNRACVSGHVAPPLERAASLLSEVDLG